eukprot:gnl/TRDRNA2_/TRDRNA2_181754_c0_seq1.p2 gnl/TRDRNA2_/TRDRNA2_181754_c0~~gnl/TRDRNA2_/TRDRNA2_181754_c0_seq1.p2  ORF type:complete len:223 (+),score=66.11 gnl/TRDRNA2_/TRDRNA2_181754_c0_seq1:65-670(+)
MMRALFALTLVLAATALRGPDKEDFKSDADDIKNMMESVKVQTAQQNGVEVKQAEPKAQKTEKTVKGSEQFPELDSEIMQKADRIEKEMSQLGNSGKKAALASQKQETEKSRASRYFATHGMQNMASILGEQLSQSAADAAKKEMETARHQLYRTVEVKLPAGAKSVASSNSAADLMDEEDASYKRRWQLVDRLKNRPKVA